MTTNGHDPGAEPQNRGAEVQRDAQGRMLPGATLNPGGRPKVWRELQEAVRDRTPRALEIIDEALGSDDPEERRWAAERVLAYGWGKPPQRLHVGADDAAPPLDAGPRIDWGRLPPDRLGQLLEIIDLAEAQGGRPR